MSIIIAYSLTMLLVESVLFKRVRESFEGSFVGNMLKCMYCTGMWVGFGLYFIYPPTTQFNIFINILLSGLYYSAIIWWIHLLEDKLFN